MRRHVEVKAQPEVQGQTAGDLPVILEVRRNVIVLPPREQRVVGRTIRIAQQKSGVAVAADGVALVPDSLRKSPVAGEAEDVTGVLLQIIDLAHVEAALDRMLARDLGHVKAELVRIGVVVALSAPERVVAGKVPAAEVN